MNRNMIRNNNSLGVTAFYCLLLHSKIVFLYGFSSLLSCPTSSYSHVLQKRQQVAISRIPSIKCRRHASFLPLYETKEDDRIDKEVSKVSVRHIPQKVYTTYVDYVTRLWRETDPDVRRSIASRKTASAVKRVEHIMRGEEYVDLGASEADTKEDIENRQIARTNLIDACEVMLKNLNDKNVDLSENQEEQNLPNSNNLKSLIVKKKKSSRSVLFGASMGAIVACWVFSGNYIFTGLFTLMTILGQLEYYRMVMNAGIYPARRISVFGACSMFLTALFAPDLHQICLPAFGCYAMIWFLTMRRKVTSISEVATTFTGMFYLGYIPSFWVRTRLIGGGIEPTRLAPIVGPILELLGQKANTSLPSFLPKSVHLPITTGAIFIFWSWISIAFSDVGAYFVGRKFGKTKLGDIAPAAGAASPNKTVEGFLGGTIVCACFATAGAWIQRWPIWYVTGPLHGAMLAFLGLVGDLTASMLKRDAGIKDFGDLIPEHGGIMDRVDSFVFTAPYSWFVCRYVIPFLKGF
mmetsp:Transcript_605/g.989  ORF Transcript_605/g.989 Transcript_605/m.989 type:complete len:521 (-) Transcript_605:64-1626(-)